MINGIAQVKGNGTKVRRKWKEGVEEKYESERKQWSREIFQKYHEVISCNITSVASLISPPS